MSTLNKVTKVYQPGGVVDESTIQDHLDQQNTDGWSLVYVENIGGWYRFYWKKDV